MAEIKKRGLGVQYYQDDGSPKEVVMVYRGLQVGGIETLIVRLSEYLVSEGFHVSLVAANGPLAKLLDTRVFFYEVAADFDHMNLSALFVKRISPSAQAIVMSFDPLSRFMMEYCLSRYYASGELKDIVHVSGIFHPRAYFNEDENFLHKKLNIFLARILRNQGLYFMNTACRDSHAAPLKLNQSEGSIVRIPVKISKASWEPGVLTDVKIIAVGRLVNFKAYNFGLLDIAEFFSRQDTNVTITIYGDGEQHDTLNHEIQARGLETTVRLAGTLNYFDFAAEVLKYDLFVGMGTAALEAAATGIPTLVALDNERTECMGFIHELPAGFIGEHIKNYKTKSLLSCVQSYAQLEPVKRVELGRLCRERAQESSESDFFLDLANVIKKTPVWRARYFSGLATYFYFKITQTLPQWKRAVYAALMGKYT